ncbi:MAG TPA: acyl-CoA dehydrogenase family protein [Acidimicrobiales bacterium]|nr:acyl-CoA dehydrogenase family protein [Acidimicrobiales bacterium]
MNFELTDELAMLQKTAREFVERTCPPEQAKAWDEQHETPPELFRAMAAIGWFGLPFSEDVGGGGGGPLELVLIAEELGRASLDIAMCYIGTLIAGLTVSKWGTEDHRATLLPALISGEQRLAIGISEPDAGSDAASMRTFAEDRDDHFLVNGQKMWCTGAGVPDTHIMAYCRTDREAPKHGGLSVLLIDPTSDGVELRRIPTLARHILGTYEVFLRDVEVPRDRLVGPLNGGWKVLLSSLELERVLMSGGYVGAAQATLDEALAYSKVREQFGRAIGTFQSLAHELADLQVEIDSARLLTHRAAWMLAEKQDCSREGAMAKLKGSETYIAAARLGMQILAGHGFATESVMSFRWRESIVATISGGTSQIQRNAIARSMGLRSY